MNITELFSRAESEKISDIFIVAGMPLSFKTAGSIVSAGGDVLLPADTEALVKEIYTLAGSRHYDRYMQIGDDDFSCTIPRVGRFRVSAFRQRGSHAAVIRVVPFEMPDPDVLGIPPQVIELYNRTKGMILVSGPAGSGKSTTLSCLINKINNERTGHIMTLEDPIEYLHRHKKSIVSQREISTDTDSYVKALRAALRQAPDVILIGEMRDLETINIALTAAETGHLVLSTLHTLGAASTIGRIIDVFPADQQQQVRIMISLVLQAVISQQLVPTVDGGKIAVFEIMMVTNAISNMIRESKLHQIDSVIYSSAEAGMLSMDASLAKLFKAGKITRETALVHSTHPDALLRQIGG